MNQLGDKILLSTKEAYHIVAFDDILYCKSNNSYTTFYLRNGDEIFTSISIGQLEDRLQEHLFVRSHQSYIVNMLHILKMYKKRTYVLELINHTLIPISSRRKINVLQFLEKFKRIQEI